MPVKIKPSTKDYIRDSRGKMTNKWVWKHYTVSNTTTEELQKLYKNDSYKRKKEVIKKEYVKCAQDPAYFMKKYCVVQHPMKGKVPFHLFPYQEESLKTFEEHRFNGILKARQLGLSTLTAGYSLWMMTFGQDKNILVSATKQDTAKNLVTKVRVMHANLSLIHI